MNSGREQQAGDVVVEHELSGLRQHLRVLEHALNALQVGVAIIYRNGECKPLNDAYRRILGDNGSADIEPGRARWADSGQPVNSSEWAAARAIETGRSIPGQVIVLSDSAHKDRVVVLDSAVPLLDAAGEVVGAVDSVQDITEMRRNQVRLFTSENLLASALRTDNLFAFSWDLKSGVLERSENCASILGIDATGKFTLSGEDHLASIPEEDRGRYKDCIGSLRPGRADYEIEYRALPDDGRVIWLDEHGRAEFDSDGRLIQIHGVVAEATERINNREREKRSAVATTAAKASIDTVSAMGEGVALLDSAGTIREVNAAFAALIESEQEDLCGRSITDILSDKFDGGVEQINRMIESVQENKDSRAAGGALKITAGENRHKWVVPTVSAIRGDDGGVVGVVLMLLDFTDLILMQQKLTESERKYRELVELANSIIMRVNRRLEVTFYNEYAAEFFGYRPEEVLGRSVFETLIPEADSKGRDMRRKAEIIVGRPELYGSIESESMLKEGRRVWIHWSIRAVRDRMGEVSELLCIGTDITERKRLEHHAERYRNRLQALAEQLSLTEEQERRKVSAHIHDTVIQTLSLANIRIGGIRKAVRDAGLDEVSGLFDKVLELMNAGITECRELMTEIMPPLLYEVGLGPAIEEFAARQQKRHEKAITVENNGAPTMLSDAKRGLLFQAARELIMNAIKHAGPCTIQVRITCEDDNIMLTVHDTGRGFDPASLDNRKMEVTRGGFGFFNIRERLSGLGGSLDVESTPGDGTTVKLHVPLGRDESPPSI